MFKDLFTTTPKTRGIYAFTKQKQGEFLVYIGKDELCYNFMQLPDRYPISLTIKTFKAAKYNKELEYIEQLPIDIYETCIANIEKKI